jgi:putative methyltransferase (TIGR04325 family)
MGLLVDLGKKIVLSVPYTREKYLQNLFLTRPPVCKGDYRSFAGAAAGAPAGKLAGYDHRSVVDLHRPFVDEFNSGDYPVLFWLLRLLPSVRRIFELGGSIGRGYYAYRAYLPFPPELRWTICETPETAQVGEDIARERKDAQLAFTSDRQPVEAPELYATFGTLQYIEQSFAEIIGSLRARPPHLLINRVPLGEGYSFVTLQNNGSWFSPYKVEDKVALIQGIGALGYELVDQWKVARENQFLTLPGPGVPLYYGMYFRLKRS